MLRLVENTDARKEPSEYWSLDELAREGARRRLVEALEAEVASYLERHVDERGAPSIRLQYISLRAARDLTLLPLTPSCTQLYCMRNTPSG
jgi:hypothetical protein